MPSNLQLFSFSEDPGRGLAAWGRPIQRDTGSPWGGYSERDCATGQEDRLVARGQVWRRTILAWSASLPSTEPLRCRTPTPEDLFSVACPFRKRILAAGEAVSRSCHAKVCDRLLPNRGHHGGSVQGRRPGCLGCSLTAHRRPLGGPTAYSTHEWNGRPLHRKLSAAVLPSLPSGSG